MPSDITSPNVHQISEVLRAIEKAGGPLTPAQWNLVVEQPKLAAAINSRIRNHGVEDVFPGYEQQLENVRHWLADAGLIWSFGSSQFKAAHDVISRLPEATLEPLQGVFLVPRLRVYADTLRLLWGAVQQTHPGIRSEFGSNLEHLEMADDEVEPTPEPILEWVQLDLTANVGLPLIRTPSTGRYTGQRGEPLAGYELLAAAAHARGWVHGLGPRFPRVALGHCRWRAGDRNYYVPALSCSNGDIPYLLKLHTTLGHGILAQPTVKVLYQA